VIFDNIRRVEGRRVHKITYIVISKDMSRGPTWKTPYSKIIIFGIFFF
jgi:hypothetical protein